MLLAKIRYALGDHQGALDRLEEVALDSLPLRDISSRKMKLIGECFAIKGLRLKKIFCTVGRCGHILACYVFRLIL